MWEQAALDPGSRADWQTSPANPWPAQQHQQHQQPFQHQQQQAIPAPVAASAARPRLPPPPPLPPAAPLALAGGQQHATLASGGYAACQPYHADPLPSGSSLYNGRLAGAVAHKPAASAAAAAEALRACRRLNGRIKKASTPQVGSAPRARTGVGQSGGTSCSGAQPCFGQPPRAAASTHLP